MLTIQGMNIAPVVHWHHPNGSVVETGGRFKVYTEESKDSVTTLSLSFAPIQQHDEGVYTCRASVNVPWMSIQPQVKHATVEIVVICKSYS